MFTLGSIIPILRIFDEAKAREFYVDFLGFQIDWEHRFEPGMPLYMQVSKDGARLHLSEHFGDGTPGTYVRIECAGVREYQQALLAKRYKNARPGVQEQEWGTREMSISDPFNNKLIFWEQLAK
jgi:uncharacterized glyoxalase superfamily protein PhnB